jgi:hypothetical protein
MVRPPRPGELSTHWRVVMACTWILVAAALVAVWRVSDQLGLSTWWLGPRGEPRSRAVQIMPLLPAVAMLLVSINRVRHAAWYGIAAAAAIVAIGIGDLDRTFRLGLLEVTIGVAAAVVSAASSTGTYRRRAAG